MRHRIRCILERLGSLFSSESPLAEEVRGDPFLVLLSALLSHRTKDETTLEAVRRLKGRIKGPEDLLRIDLEELQGLIYPVGLYRRKARLLKEVSRRLLEDFAGRVPDNMEELLSLRGVGRKTANLVLAQGYGREALAVDVHVHRVANRLGLVNSSKPEKTEQRLKELIPKELWSSVNLLFVQFGKGVCRPVSPSCCLCPISDMCEKRGVRS